MEKDGISVDLKVYGRTLEKLIRMYNVMYQISSKEFIEQFWSKDIQEVLGCDNNEELIQKLTKIDQVQGINEETRAFEKLVISLDWKCTKACRYLLREILKMVYYEIRSIEKIKDDMGRYRASGKRTVFLHPMFECREISNKQKEISSIFL